MFSLKTSVMERRHFVAIYVSEFNVKARPGVSGLDGSNDDAPRLSQAYPARR
jgi:hypothetical protein